MSIKLTGMFTSALIWENPDIVNASLIAVLNDAERRTVAETEPDALAALDEDEAIALEARIRRARDKYVSQYRRRSSARVAEKGGRAKGSAENEQAVMKVEAFERALARVSRRVAALAQKAAADLRAERLAAARKAKRRPVVPAPRTPRARSTAVTEGNATGERLGDRALRSPASEKRRAGTQALGARRQARRDTKRTLAR
jgi:hypothetical protein